MDVYEIRCYDRNWHLVKLDCGSFCDMQQAELAAEADADRLGCPHFEARKIGPWNVCKMGNEKKYTFTLDQVDMMERWCFMNHHGAMLFGGIDMEKYYTVDHGEVMAKNEQAACEKLFERYNADRPVGYEGRSMSVSDIVTLWDNSGAEPVKTIWYCDSVGFKQIDETGKEVRV